MQEFTRGNTVFLLSENPWKRGGELPAASPIIAHARVEECHETNLLDDVSRRVIVRPGCLQSNLYGRNAGRSIHGCIAIATCASLSAQGIAWNEIGRQAIQSDPAWNGGDYYDGPQPA